MGNEAKQSTDLNLADTKIHAIDDIKSSFQSQSVGLNDFAHPFNKSIYGHFDFEQFLIDANGKYWFTEKSNVYKQTTQIYIFNNNGDLLKNFSVKGRPTLYENDKLMIAACEGKDDRGHIYLYCKNELAFIEEWTIDGFLWDMECIGETFYITSYFVDTNEAVFYIIGDNTKKVMSLGDDMFPTGILFHQNKLYISLTYLQDGNRGKVIQTDLDGRIIKEIEMDIAPRKLFSYKDELVIYGLDMAKGYADQLVYINVHTDQQAVYQSPRAVDIKSHDKHMLFYNQQTDSIIYWSHEKKKIIRVVHWAVRQYNNKLQELPLNH